MKTVAGLDVHKDSVYLCILRENGEKIERVYGVLTPQLDSMRDFMAKTKSAKSQWKAQVCIGFPFGAYLLTHLSSSWLILTSLGNFLGVRVTSRMLNGLQNAS